MDPQERDPFELSKNQEGKILPDGRKCLVCWVTQHFGLAEIGNGILPPCSFQSLQLGPRMRIVIWKSLAPIVKAWYWLFIGWGWRGECLMGEVETWIYGKDVGISSCKLWQAYLCRWKMSFLLYIRMFFSMYRIVCLCHTLCSFSFSFFMLEKIIVIHVRGLLEQVLYSRIILNLIQSTNVGSHIS